MTDLLGPAVPGAVTERPADTRIFGPDDTWMVDCSSETAEDGTPIAAPFLNGLLAQVRRAIRGMNIAVNNADDDMLLKALQKTSASSVPIVDARSYLPILPKVETISNKLAITVGTGQVQVDANQLIIHRGIVGVSTSSFDAGQRTFATVASKTYHLRWHAPGTGDAVPATSWPNGRFVLKDLANNGYNPSTVAETHRSFDTSFDDMLVARVVTNGSNVPTVRSLVNLPRLYATAERTARTTGPNWGALTGLTGTLDWARTPLINIQQFSCEVTSGLDAVDQVLVSGTRYDFSAFVAGYVINGTPGNDYISGSITLGFHA